MQKNSIGWALAKYVYVSGICAEGILQSFPWWLKNVKSRSKISLFFKWAPFWNLISKKVKQLHFSEENYKNTILHLTFTFSLKQGETRTSSGPIWVPLTYVNFVPKYSWASPFRHLYTGRIRFTFERLSKVVHIYTTCFENSITLSCQMALFASRARSEEVGRAQFSLATHLRGCCIHSIHLPYNL